MRTRRLQIDDDYWPQLLDRGGGMPLVAIHGTPLDARCWDRLDLPGRRLIAYDLRGHGSAASVAPARSYEQLADDLTALLDRLELDRAEILGHSFGGQVAQTFAARHPERTARLWVVNSRCAPFPPFAQIAERVDREGVVEVGAEWLRRWFGEEAIERGSPGVRYARDRLARADPAVLAAALRLIAPFSLPPALETSAVPATFIAAERDPIASAEVLAEGARRTGGEFVLAPGVGHMLPVENPALLARLLSG